MKPVEVVKTDAVAVPQTVRPDEVRAITSCRAGKIVPLWATTLLREDRVSRGSVRVQLAMEETVRPLMNAVRAKVMVHFVPWLAFNRFQGLDEFNRSYKVLPEAHNGIPITFFQQVAYSNSAPFWRTLGIHAVNGEMVDAHYVEAYNELVNWRRLQRSIKLPVRTLLDTTLAEAFWHTPNLWHIVPDFEQAMMDGQVALTLTGRAAVSGIGVGVSNAVAPTGPSSVRDTSNSPLSYPLQIGSAQPAMSVRVTGGTAGTARADVWAELAGVVGQVSLANIDLAKRTAAFAKMRQQFAGLSDDHLMDLLMDGIRIPDEAMKQPILLAQQVGQFGYSERFATDGANLAKSVTTGTMQMDMTFRTPPMNTGGVIIVTAEIVPEPLFERMQDRFLHISNPNNLPAYVSDELDPDKVETVQNRYVDVLHGTPTGLFGYAPLNHWLKRSMARAGGKFFRPVVNSFVEDRQRIWSVDQVNPALTTDFYLVRDGLTHSVFADTVADPFEVVTLGSLEIAGATVFGMDLSEKDDHYMRVDVQVDKSRVVSV